MNHKKEINYIKPNIANLHGKIGQSIVDTIMNAQRPDHSELNRACEEFEKSLNASHNHNICLVIIFNHRYDQNIEKLERIYETRFHEIRYLVPFYDGANPKVLPVYECSYQFPGYLAQTYNELMSIGADYYLFLADDIILDPKLNENNILDAFHMQNKKALTFSFCKLNSPGRFSWIHARYSSRPFFHKSVLWKESLCPYDQALVKFKNFFGSDYEETYKDSFFDKLPGETEADYEMHKEEFLKFNGNSLAIPYPMATGFADAFCLSKDILPSISHTCGIFSAMNLFAEISFPTAIVLNIHQIVFTVHP